MCAVAAEVATALHTTDTTRVVHLDLLLWVWRFAQADLGTLDPDVALPKLPEPDVHRLIV